MLAECSGKMETRTRPARQRRVNHGRVVVLTILALGLIVVGGCQQVGGRSSVVQPAEPRRDRQAHGEGIKALQEKRHSATLFPVDPSGRVGIPYAEFYSPPNRNGWENVIKAREPIGPKPDIRDRDILDRVIRKPDIIVFEGCGADVEIWIIERSGLVKPEPRIDARIVRTTRRTDYETTQGELRAMLGQRQIPLPLEHTDVQAQIDGFLASVNVTQQYQNPYDTKIEAVYVFPLPETAAVTDFLMVIGGRRIRGMIREKEEAKRTYEEARRQGYRASLLTQERPNVFEQKVANIEPGRRIDVQITYFNPLHYRDGEYEFVFPMVVGPRFNPAGRSDGVGAVARGSYGASGQRTEVEYLRPGERSGHDISVRVDIEAGVSIESISSNTHDVDVERVSASRAVAQLCRHDSIPNRDFVLRYRTAGSRVKTALMTHHAEDGNYFALLLMPAVSINTLPRIPREMVFVLDCSGSMEGKPLAKAKEAVRRCLLNLDRDDTFQIIRFSNNASRLGRAPIPATRDNVQRGLEYLNGLNSGGGTMMIEGIKAALDFPHDEDRLRVVSFMTDGYIGNEAEILAAVRQKVGPARVFSFGVGSSVNRYLLESMARLGRGAVAYVGLDDEAGREVDMFYERIAHPALADVKIDWGRMRVSDVYPRSIPDVFVGRPVVLTGRFKCDAATQVRVSGRMGRERVCYTMSVDPGNLDAEHAGIRTVWGRWRIADLSDRELYAPSHRLRREITETSLKYRLLCRYTAFLAVDSLRRTSGDHGTTVGVPVPTPEGVRYETTVEER